MASSLVPVLTFRDALLFTVTSALFSHLVFNKFEPNKPRPLVVLLGLLPLIPTATLSTHYASLWQPFVVAYTTYYTALLLSVGIYRVSPFHPLSRYPGPLPAKLSKFWSVWIASTGKQHEYFKRLHEKFGPCVRISPNELSFLDAGAIAPIMGNDGLPKGPMWDGRRHPDWNPSLIGTRDIQDHKRRRNRWNRAFTSASVKEYEPTISRRALQLVEQLEKRAKNKETVDIAKWLSFFTFDFMGDMAFGGGFELMQEDDKDGLWKVMEEGIGNASLIHHIPWACRYLMQMNIFTKDTIALRSFGLRRVTARKEQGSHVKDMFHHIIDEDGLEPIPPPFSEIVSDAILAIVAGSDTTATVMSNLFYGVLTNPSHYARLRKEVDTIFPPGEGNPFDAAKLAEIPILNATINEALRLSPAVVNGTQRATPRGSGGKMIGEHYVPGGTALIVPTYSLHRDKRYFSPAPDMFWPDRWLFPSGTLVEDPSKANVKHEKVPLVTDHSAFIPFSVGPANCVGKNLAQVEMRMIVSLLVQRFEMRLIDEYDPKDWERKLEDRFVLKKSILPIVIKDRSI
ncbi:high nitrogen upregulated cytochrome P450 monooxygenase 2 [Rickenella mellea]|uniref:High nitrogen upregulated cytochrome P450 monooxygenase 2 n=1 Tax=Rickenella mellea TaxID=50990 RepID=A0A4Y7PWY6_9AGAM|nr:high nitrogen upregulated cytochrome P450 monooxygenase 2 [Rickenella mellea]